MFDAISPILGRNQIVSIPACPQSFENRIVYKNPKGAGWEASSRGRKKNFPSLVMSTCETREHADMLRLDGPYTVRFNSPSFCNRRFFRLFSAGYLSQSACFGLRIQAAGAVD